MSGTHSNETPPWVLPVLLAAVLAVVLGVLLAILEVYGSGDLLLGLRLVRLA